MLNTCIKICKITRFIILYISTNYFMLLVSVALVLVYKSTKFYQEFTFILMNSLKYEIFSNYQLGGIALAVCPNPKLGLVPNHDIFHSRVS